MHVFKIFCAAGEVTGTAVLPKKTSHHLCCGQSDRLLGVDHFVDMYDDLA